LVWDALVRFFHWSLVVAFVIAYVSEGEPLTLHVWAGYVIGALVVLRIVWGFIGSPHARFSDFVFPAGRVISYLSDEIRFRGRRYLGHSPAGGAMVIALLFMLLATTGSGLTLFAVHEGKGPFSTFIARADNSSPQPSIGVAGSGEEASESPTVELWEEVHEVLANLTLLLVLLHVGGVALASYSHKENLIAAMLDGKKRP
jgi:cytochrome b